MYQPINARIVCGHKPYSYLQSSDHMCIIIFYYYNDRLIAYAL